MISIDLDSAQPNAPVWKWNNVGSYTSASTYAMIWEGSIHFSPASAIWKCWTSLSCKLFMWLATQYRLWTSDQRLRHGLQDQSSPCYICDQQEYSVDHILLRCGFARQVWHNSFMRARLLITLVPSTEASIGPWWMTARKLVPKDGRKGFDSHVMLICWQLWKNRNGIVFGPRTARTMAQDKTMKIFEELKLWVRAGGRGVHVFCE